LLSVFSVFSSSDKQLEVQVELQLAKLSLLVVSYKLGRSGVSYPLVAES